MELKKKFSKEKTKPSRKETKDEISIITPDPIASPPENIGTKPKEPEYFTISEQNFPTLQHDIISGTTFDGLKATECFEVFFDDDAPFSFQQFQQKLGDIDIVYEKWEETTNSPLSSFHPNATTPSDSLTKQMRRVTSFQTLTKSYFGPAYAQAKKIQVATFFSDALVILENKTILSGIPFGDKFFVLERWILQTQDENTSRLNASVQVCMLISSCPFESQIKKKSVQGCTQMVTLWTRSATEALELTKLKRKQQEEERDLLEEDEEEEDEEEEESLSLAELEPPLSQPSTDSLVHMHMTKLKELENMIASARSNGTLEHIQVIGDDSKCVSNNLINTSNGIEVFQLLSAPIQQEEEGDSDGTTHKNQTVTKQSSKREIQNNKEMNNKKDIAGKIFFKRKFRNKKKMINAKV